MNRREMLTMRDLIEWRMWQVGQCLRNTKDYPFTDITFFAKRLKALIELERSAQ